MTLSEKILVAKADIEAELKLKKSMKSVLENLLGLTTQNMGAIYTIKYYLEQDPDDLTDSAMLFVNSLIRVFSSSVDSIDSIKDFNAEIESLPIHLREINLRDHIRKNSGIATSPISRAKYENGCLIVGRKDVTLHDDGSLSYAVKTNTQIRYFLDTITNTYSYMFSRNRAKELADMFNVLIESGYFLSTDNAVIVVGVKNSTGTKIRYTVFDEPCIADITSGDGSYCEKEDIIYEEVFFEAWVI